ncbi:carboxymuconolactone decarboxylase family protein [Methanospirillum sp. J.3.6.1-F.2.7.3]|jgi:AhpD family alkylhydroperoxidase|uniref:Carboxymuconolactone decarboxylase family protein n=2 Tax=Methanospirillum TaxID=2202 RepID=A0A8E7B0F8_9EURY|nr:MULTISPECIES: carboxymuconolactone decarboxylase family protein [Methanospirillum]MDX8549150.1 carboxymuconolactone decarboxylase family protein [Methanospirillum hungatei]NLW76820.1 carboxymuconolactone decarboxylase family protein [Methanomicrobiales archaeon]QVV88823.1 carboxymuconolactone decarboxylase family protein [Methanospirillum sp. J.3.6.1-F.2.7.3]QXO93837.1 carboxymuconolactone decarboxylase family protein [Methanospirillum hungatei]
MGKPKNGFENIIKEVLEHGAAETAQEWVEAIRKDYGRAPLIFERMSERPEVLISHLLYKNSVLKTGTLDPKIVELISLAVSAALRCNHCTDYHVQAALRKGANPDEILEAIMIAGLTSQSTVLADAYRTYSDTIEECISCGMKIPESINEDSDSSSGKP